MNGCRWAARAWRASWSFNSSWQPGFFPKRPPSGWRDNADLLVPDFFDPDTDKWHIAVQSWVIEVDGLTVVVDTGVGNDRQRPHMPPLDHLNTGFLAALQSAGVDRNAVDVVINTHIHSDHVGWNTMLDKDIRATWVPTFPNARYLVPAADYHHFAPDGPAARQSPSTDEEAAQQRGNQLVFADSVLPIDDAGQLVLWSGDYRDQRVAATAARRRAYTGLLGVVAGCGSAGGLRRRSHPQPGATAATRRRLRLRHGCHGRRGDPSAHIHRGGAGEGRRDTRALSRSRRCDASRGRGPIRRWPVVGHRTAAPTMNYGEAWRDTE